MINTICVCLSALHLSSREHGISTHIRAILLILGSQDIPKHVDWCIGLNSDTGLHAFIVDKPDQFAGTRGTGGGVCGLGAGGGIDGGLVVEAVQIAAGLLEFPNPFMRLEMDAHEFGTQIRMPEDTKE